ncbi:MAG: LysM peptidoglycan-binding domain-containing protein [Myxococcales bacterium]|nr:LysM peptidoglycan-binding domain-containing protein [Myxococcales bacterium]
MRLSPIFAGLLWIAAPSLLLAQEQAEALDEGIDVAEALRLARVELDALDVGEDPSEPIGAPAIAVESTPPLLSSDLSAPARAPERQAAPAPWLEGIALPDIPIRWDRRLVEMLEYYRDNPRGRGHIRAWMQRSGRYEGMIRRTFREAGLPEDLLYVAMVESGYDPTVESPAGAMGMWQFVKATGSDYDLEVNRWVDERRSPEQATRAAAAFFEDLHGRLGSWPLSLAAFNMGYGALLRSIRKYNSNDFWLLSRVEAGLPYETIAYVHKVMACAIIAHNPERFGLGDLQKDPPVGTTLVQVPGGTGLGRLARAASMTQEALAKHNPELRRKRLPPDVRQYPLRIPNDKVERFRSRWPQLQANRASHGVHVLRFGERLRDVAQMYGTTEVKLRRLNDLSRSEQVQPGTRLKVPDVEPKAPETPSSAIVGVPDRSFAYDDRRHVFYHVIPGDRLDSIARFFQVSSDELAAWNDVSSDARLHSGMVLQLFVPASVDLQHARVVSASQVETLVVGSEPFLDHHEEQRDRVRVRYRVKDGDTLRSLSKRFDLSVGSIARINGFSRYTKLQPDNRVILYVPSDQAARARR